MVGDREASLVCISTVLRGSATPTSRPARTPHPPFLGWGTRFAEHADADGAFFIFFCVFAVTSEEDLPAPGSERFTCKLSSKSFVVSTSTFKSMAHLELTFTCDAKQGSDTLLHMAL